MNFHIWRVILMRDVCLNFIFNCPGDVKFVAHVCHDRKHLFQKALRHAERIFFSERSTLLLAKRGALSSLHDCLWLFAFSASAAIVCLWNYPRPNCLGRLLRGWSFGRFIATPPMVGKAMLFQQHRRKPPSRQGYQEDGVKMVDTLAGCPIRIFSRRWILKTKRTVGLITLKPGCWIIHYEYLKDSR